MPVRLSCRYHYGKITAARAQEAAKLDLDEEEAAVPLKGESAVQQPQEGYRTRGSWAGGDK